MATNTGDSHPAVGHADPSLKEHSPVCKCEIRSVAPMGRPTSKSKQTRCFNVHRNHMAYWGRGEGGGREGVWRWGKREIIFISLHSHHQNGSCIKMGSDESHCEGQSQKTTTFLKRKESRRSFCLPAYRLTALPLGQTG